MNLPGNLDELEQDGRAAWDKVVNECSARALASIDASSLFLDAANERMPELTAVDWTALPTRVVACLTRRRALSILDARGDGDSGGRCLQEEYAEWRVARDGEGVVTRFELTTELGAYWRVLAGYAPGRLLQLVAEFAGDEMVPATAVFGDLAPHVKSAAPAERAQAFTHTMLNATACSPYNDGRRAICCMVQQTNTLWALVALFAAATAWRAVRDEGNGRRRCLTAAECIPLLGHAAQLGRGSDPVLVERLGRLAFEGRHVAVDDPIGVYIAGVEHTRLRTPGGEPIPAEWFRLGRGIAAAYAPDGRSRCQRVTFAVPAAESGLRVGDLVDIATEQPLRHGGELADLVQLVVRLRVSAASTADAMRDACTELRSGGPDPLRCQDVRAHAARLSTVTLT